MLMDKLMEKIENALSESNPDYTYTFTKESSFAGLLSFNLVVHKK